MTTSTQNHKVFDFIIRSIMINMMNVKIFYLVTKITFIWKVLKRFFSIKSNFISNFSFKHAGMRTINVWSVFVLVFGFYKRKINGTNNAFFCDSCVKFYKFIFTFLRATNFISFLNSIRMNVKILVANWTRNIGFIYKRSSYFIHANNLRQKRRCCQ